MHVSSEYGYYLSGKAAEAMAFLLLFFYEPLLAFGLPNYFGKYFLSHVTSLVYCQDAWKVVLSIFSSGLVPFLFRDVENALILMIVFMAVGGGRTCIYLWSFSSVSKDYSHSRIRYCSFHLLKDLAPVSLSPRKIAFSNEIIPFSTSICCDSCYSFFLKNNYC